MNGLIKLVSNELENNKIEYESELNKILNMPEVSVKEKKEIAIKHLKELGALEVGASIWQNLITPKDGEVDGETEQKQEQK